MNTLYINCEEELYNFYVKSENFITDSGFDLYCVEDQVIKSGSRSNKVNLKVRCRLENSDGSHVGYMLFPRSSMGSKTPLRLSNSVGVIDSTYRGYIMGLVDNLSTEDYQIKKGDRLFQLVAFDGKPISCVYEPILDETERGGSGFGSTGK